MMIIVLVIIKCLQLPYIWHAARANTNVETMSWLVIFAYTEETGSFAWNSTVQIFYLLPSLQNELLLVLMLCWVLFLFPIRWNLGWQWHKNICIVYSGRSCLELMGSLLPSWAMLCQRFRQVSHMLLPLSPSSWEVNSHTQWYSDHVSVILQLKLMSDQGLLLKHDLDLFLYVKDDVKWCSCSWYISELWMECHLPYGITQCYLPPDTSAPVTPH